MYNGPVANQFGAFDVDLPHCPDLDGPCVDGYDTPAPAAAIIKPPDAAVKAAAEADDEPADDDQSPPLDPADAIAVATKALAEVVGTDDAEAKPRKTGPPGEEMQLR